jgi:hypothetical protein
LNEGLKEGKIMLALTFVATALLGYILFNCVPFNPIFNGILTSGIFTFALIAIIFSLLAVMFALRRLQKNQTTA